MTHWVGAVAIFTVLKELPLTFHVQTLPSKVFLQIFWAAPLLFG